MTLCAFPEWYLVFISDLRKQTPDDYPRLETGTCNLPAESQNSIVSRKFDVISGNVRFLPSSRFLLLVVGLIPRWLRSLAYKLIKLGRLVTYVPLVNGARNLYPLQSTISVVVQDMEIVSTSSMSRFAIEIDSCHAELVRGPFTMFKCFSIEENWRTINITMSILFLSFVLITLNSLILIDFSKIDLILCHSILYFLQGLN